jgi:hypothetical protein
MNRIIKRVALLLGAAAAVTTLSITAAQASTVHPDGGCRSTGFCWGP